MFITDFFNIFYYENAAHEDFVALLILCTEPHQGSGLFLSIIDWTEMSDSTQ